MDSIVRFPQLLMSSVRNDPWLWAAGAAVVVVVLAGVLWHYRTRQRRRLRRSLRALGPQVLRDVMIPDSVEGHVHADYLVLSPAGILVVDIKDYRGMLFGGENTDIWTQVVDGRSYKFENPLYRNRVREAAVRALVPGAEVRSVVVFTDAGHFPRKRPAGVCMLSSLGEELGSSEGAVPARLQSVWNELAPRVQGQPL